MSAVSALRSAAVAVAAVGPVARLLHEAEPVDHRHRDDDAQKNGASETSRRQRPIERNARPERQAPRTATDRVPRVSQRAAIIGAVTEQKS